MADIPQAQIAKFARLSPRTNKLVKLDFKSRLSKSMANVIVAAMNETTMEREGSHSENGEFENTNAEVTKQIHSETKSEGESMERIDIEVRRITKIRCERRKDQNSSTFQKKKSSKIQTRTTSKSEQKDQESDTFIIRTRAQLRRLEKSEYT
ncbi:uncharacterized protein MONOS_8131 [Monocercomonoides exilis]|uniref:uncharacterized protein n=1 Tax=Monocercomonoides exilis TaxID=2049356 RepID=UPI0035596A7C|nr:hypothetical protein MONOS_8131 [Monocercomonoides exilis]|eukprot:MONOS_8131.1-p1 / transcript=MONOS_8131.1 / gene=MONOS_8131 / organism=Monocercomonoides_exilis_PA203 / gene_product=unspecified product / transcript_product=unspecified product / location=Mono_scaffold00298:3672-4127(+) / protein_length=152 / sequence_SO=supercontig / SO=protein_coding / is_pseudo=false